MIGGSGKISGATLAETAKSRGGKTGYACSPCCVIRCSNIHHDPDGIFMTAGLEFKTIALMGSSLRIDPLDVIATLDHRCDDYGLDTMEMGNAIGVATEVEIAAFGDGKAALSLVDKAAQGTINDMVSGHRTRRDGNRRSAWGGRRQGAGNVRI
jgi:aldehyde:ferredoxin oxidoreductase